MSDKKKIVQSVVLHHTLLKAKAETDQFIAGLQLGSLEAIKQNPIILSGFFIRQGKQVINAGISKSYVL